MTAHKTETQLWPDAAGYYHPCCTEDVQHLIAYARRTRRQLRVRGAGHSEAELFETDARRAGGRFDGVELVLDRLRHIELDPSRQEVRVGAGCLFSHEPLDPFGRRVPDGLCERLEAEGWALASLGGVSRQSIAGFFSTGSEGGSLQHSVAECVLALTLVDGLGRTHQWQRGKHPEFNAALVSLGLLGVVTELTLRIEPRYDIVGRAVTGGHWETPLCMLRPGDTQSFFERSEYARALWFPQPRVDKVSVWQAWRHGQEATTDSFGTARRFEQVPRVAGSAVPAQWAAGGLLRLTTRLLHAVQDPKAPRGLQAVSSLYQGPLLSAAYRALVPNGAQRFRQSWHRGLPLDDQISESALPTRFSEIWIPLSRAEEALRRMRVFYSTMGFDGSGSYCVELYAAKASDAWLSPGFGRDSFRINIFVLAGASPQQVSRHLRPHWDLLDGLDARYHWGKILPDSLSAPDLVQRYPRLNDFLELREELDPEQVFVNKRLRDWFAIEPRRMTHTRALRPAAERVQVMRLPAPEASSSSARGLPLPIALEQVPLERMNGAPYVLSAALAVRGTQQDVFEAFTTLTSGTLWMKHLRDVSWLSTPPNSEHSRLLLHFSFMSLLATNLRVEAPSRYVARFERASLPLCKWVLEELRFVALGEEQTEIQWLFYYDLLGSMRVLHPLLKVLATGLLKDSLKAFKRWFEAQARGESERGELAFSEPPEQGRAAALGTS